MDGTEHPPHLPPARRPGGYAAVLWLGMRGARANGHAQVLPGGGVFYKQEIPMYGEFSLYGVFVPTLLALMTLAYLLNSALAALLTRAGAYRHVWHPALFNLALYVALLGGLFFLTRWMQS